MNTQHDQKLDGALAKLPRSVEPQRDLWPGIAGRIGTRRRRGTHFAWSYGFAAAAAVVVAVTATWVTLSPRAPVPGNTLTEVVPATKSTLAGPADLHAQFTAQLASDTSLPPPARKALVDNLRLIHDAIVRTQAAVKKYPNDVNLQSLLLDLYQQETQLMSEAQQAQIQTIVRTTI